MAGMDGKSSSLYSLLLIAAVSGSAAAADPGPPEGAPDVETLQRKVDRMSQELEELKAQLKQLQSQGKTPAEAQTQPPAPVAESGKTAEATQAKAPVPAATPEERAPAEMSRWDRLSLWGYGEIYYMRPTQEGSQTTADLARAVFGIGYQFDANTRFNSEFEWEHAVTSATDAGEVEVEQFYVDHNL